MCESYGYELLAEAIITQATEDYRGELANLKQANKKLAKLEKDLEHLYKQISIFKSKILRAKEQINNINGDVFSLEDFFYGEWFGQLSGGIDPDYVVKKIKMEAANEAE